MGTRFQLSCSCNCAAAARAGAGEPAFLLLVVLPTLVRLACQFAKATLNIGHVAGNAVVSGLLCA